LWFFTAERLLLYKKSLNEVSLGLLDLAMRLKMTSQSGRIYSRKFFAGRRRRLLRIVSPQGLRAPRKICGGRCTCVRRLMLLL